MQVEYIKLESIKPYKNNSKKHSIFIFFVFEGGVWVSKNFF